MKIKKEISQEILTVLRFTAKVYSHHNLINKVMLTRVLPIVDTKVKLVSLSYIPGNIFYSHLSILTLFKNVSDETVNFLSDRVLYISHLLDVFNNHDISELCVHSISNSLDIRIRDKNMTIVSVKKPDTMNHEDEANLNLLSTSSIMDFYKFKVVRKFDNANILKLSTNGHDIPCVYIPSRDDSASLIVKMPHVDINSNVDIRFMISANDPYTRPILMHCLNGADIIKVLDPIFIVGDDTNLDLSKTFYY